MATRWPGRCWHAGVAVEAGAVQPFYGAAHSIWAETSARGRSRDLNYAAAPSAREQNPPAQSGGVRSSRSMLRPFLLVLLSELSLKKRRIVRGRKKAPKCPSGWSKQRSVRLAGKVSVWLVKALSEKARNFAHVPRCAFAFDRASHLRTRCAYARRSAPLSSATRRSHIRPRILTGSSI